MPCNQCGECSYASASTATLTIVITSDGLPPECRLDSENLFPDIPYKGPGVWEQQLGRGGLLRVQSKCVSGNWLWSAPSGVIGGGNGPGTVQCAIVGEDNPGDPTRNDCGGFEQLTVTTYAGGGWMKTHVTIVINNNAECE